MSRPARWRACAPVLLVALAVAGCGDAGSGTASDDASSASSSASPSASPGSPSAAPVPAGTPACDEVWREGGTVPRSYRGCEADGALVAPDGLACSSGQRIVRFDDRFYAVPGGPVQVATSPLGDDPDYRADVRSCRG